MTGRRFGTHLSVELDGQDVVRVAVVTNLCAFLEVIDVHPPRHGQADHHHQTAGEEPLHDVDVRTLHCVREGTQQGKVGSGEKKINSLIKLVLPFLTFARQDSDGQMRLEHDIIPTPKLKLEVFSKIQDFPNVHLKTAWTLNDPALYL